MRDKPLRIRLGRAGRKQIRLDRPAGQEPESEKPATPENGLLLSSIWKSIRAHSQERRDGPRHPAAEQEIWVGWWNGEHFGALDGRLLNISRGGALIVLGHRPPRRQSVWIYKEIDSELSCVRADVAGITPAPEASYSVRFRFASPCPTVLCESAVCFRAKARESKRAGRPRTEIPPNV